MASKSKIETLSIDNGKALVTKLDAILNQIEHDLDDGVQYAELSDVRNLLTSIRRDLKNALNMN